MRGTTKRLPFGRIGAAAARVSCSVDPLVRSLHVALLLLLAGAPGLSAADAVRVVEPPPTAPLPEPLLPQQVSDPAVSTSARLIAVADGGYQEGPWTHRLCLGDKRAAAQILAGLEEAAAAGYLTLENPENDAVDWAYRQIALGCRDRGPDAAHARWLARAAREAEQRAARALLFDVLASVHPLDEPELIEQEAPDDALIAFHRRRSGDNANVYSARLAGIVERRLADGDERGLRAAAEALARSSDARAVETLRRLLHRDPPVALAKALWRPLRVSPRADGFAVFQSYCAPSLERSMDVWRANGAPMRGSPHRWGDPCAREDFFEFRSAADSAGSSTREEIPAPARCRPVPSYDPLPDDRSSETCFDLGTTRATRFTGDGQLLRTLIRLVRPHLDSAVIFESWPAVDAVSLDREELEHAISVRGDGIRVTVPPDGTGAPDAAVAATITRELERALVAERWIDVEHDGERFRFAFDPCGAPWCAEAMLEIVNVLLEARRAPVRLIRDATAESYVLRLRIEPAAGR